MSETKVTTYDHDGTTFEIYVDGSGVFSALIDGDEPHRDRTLTASTLDLLKKKIAARNRRKTLKLQLPATVLTHHGWSRNRQTRDDLATDVVITGIHARNRTVLYRDVATNKPDTISYSEKILVRLTEAEHAELKRLDAAQTAATEAYEKFLADHYYSTNEIRIAIGEAEQSAGIPSSEEEE